MTHLARLKRQMERNRRAPFAVRLDRYWKLRGVLPEAEARRISDFDPDEYAEMPARWVTGMEGA